MSLINFDTELNNMIRDAFDEMLTQFGDQCRLYYAPKFIDCPDCQVDNIGNKPSNRWITGTPVGQPVQICGFCNSTGKLAQQVTETITMEIDWSPKVYEFFSKDIKIPDGLVLSKGRIIDLPKVKTCEYAILDTSIENYQINKFKIYSEPIVPDKIEAIRNRYFYVFWQRVL